MKKNQKPSSIIRKEVIKMDAKAQTTYKIEKRIKSDEFHRKISNVPEDEEFIARYFYSKASFQCKGKDYRPALDLIVYMFEGYGFPREYALKYLSVNKFLLFKTREEILSRFAVLQLCGIDELTALCRPRILYSYTDEIIYKAMKQMKKSLKQVTSESLMEYIPDATIESKNSDIISLRLKSIAHMYAKAKGL